MINTKHTPGPWRITEARREYVTGTEHFIASIKGNEDGRYRGDVCNMQSCDHIKGITMDESEANARLIAAAPELLDILQRIDAYHGLMVSQVDRLAIKSAIAKATQP